MNAKLYTVAVSTREYAKPTPMTVIAFNAREAANRAIAALIACHDAMGRTVTPTSAVPGKGTNLI
jgi:hypothetical protein